MLEGWTIHLIYGAIGAIVVAILLAVAYVKKGGYEEEARGSVRAIVRRSTGWPLRKVVKPMPDGWVRVAKGDYKLAEVINGKKPEDITDEERCKAKGEYKVNPWAFQWGMYPSNPFMGLSRIRTPIREVEFYENNPDPIMPDEHRITITAADAQAHTREMDAMNVAIRIQESDARQKQLMEAISNQPNKTVVYVMIGIAIVVGLISVVPNLRIG